MPDPVVIFTMLVYGAAAYLMGWFVRDWMHENREEHDDHNHDERTTTP